MNIHKTAIIEGDVKLADSVSIGPHAVLRGNIEIGEGTEISTGVIIEGNVKIGKNNKIFPYATIGLLPQDYAYKGEASWVIIGDNNIIREYANIHRATGEGKATIIGNNNYLMGFVHLAHNVKVGSNVIIVNTAGLAGYVEVEDHAYVSGLVGVHQFVRIGAYSIVGGVSAVAQDVPPYMLVRGVPASVYGLNLVGLRRKGFSNERIKPIREAFRILYQKGYPTDKAVEILKKEFGENKDIAYLIEFIEKSKRGIIKKVGSK